MSAITLQQLFPQFTVVPLQGVYLDESLLAGSASGVNIYANFLTSLDGRMAVADAAAASGMSTPRSILNKHDFQLFCQLQAHADVVITHSGYMRSLSAGDLGNILTMPLRSETQYLVEFRKKVGLTVQPRIVLLSSSLDFDEHILMATGSSVSVLTVANPHAARVRQLEACGFTVHRTSSDHGVAAVDVADYLNTMKAKNAYLQTGPAFLHDIVNSGLLKRLYLTYDLSLIGGNPFKTFCDGAVFSEPCTMKLRSMYLGESVKQGAEGEAMQQLYASFDVG